MHLQVQHHISELKKYCACCPKEVKADSTGTSVGLQAILQSSYIAGV